MDHGALVGYQEYREWMGSPVLTLADVLPPRPRAIMVGLNPAPPSVAAGHYYQGKVGRRLLGVLAAHELFPPSPSLYFEETALQAGVGFTDLVKRPTARAAGVGRSELAHGRQHLTNLLANLEVPLVVCVFKAAAEALLDAKTTPGSQDLRTAWGARVFRMPPPFMPRDDAAAVMRTLQIDPV